MSHRLRIALAQMNPHEGALRANAARIRALRAEAAAQGADLLVTPEFSIAGYPPEDLVLKPAFRAMCEAEIAVLAAETADGGPGLVVGGPWVDGGKLYNAAFCWMGAGSSPAAPSTSCPITASSTTSASSTPGRRRGRWCSAACASA